MTVANDTVEQTPKLFPAATRGQKPGKWVVIFWLAIATVCLIGLFTSTTPAIAGIWCVALMLVLMFMSVPVAISLAVPSIIGIYAISGIPAAVNVLSTAPFLGVSSWTLSVLPMFIFMGMLLAQSGMTTKLYRATERWFSWLPGGIGVGTLAAGAGLSSVSGSTIGMTYALGRAGIPEMLRAGFDKRMAVGTVIVAGLPGGLIPPSILLVIYAGIASVPVGPQLVAGAVPGFLLALSFSIFVIAIGIFAPRLVGRTKGDDASQPTYTWGDRFRSLGEIWGFPVIMAVLFGGMFSGWFTPTEAGAAAALASLLVTLHAVRNDKPLNKIAQAAFSTVAATAAIFFIMIGAEMLTRLLAITGLAPTVTDFITGLGLNRISFLILMIFVYLILGMFFDTLAMMLLTIPILLPTLELLEISPIWFGVFVVLLGELAMVTPPVGILSFVIHGISKNPEVNLGHDIKLGDIFKSLAWFLPIAVLFLVLMILFPEMTEWLPALLQ